MAQSEKRKNGDKEKNEARDEADELSLLPDFQKDSIAHLKNRERIRMEKELLLKTGWLDTDQVMYSYFLNQGEPKRLASAELTDRPVRTISQWGYTHWTEYYYEPDIVDLFFSEAETALNGREKACIKRESRGKPDAKEYRQAITLAILKTQPRYRKEFVELELGKMVERLESVFGSEAPYALHILARMKWMEDQRAWEFRQNDGTPKNESWKALVDEACVCYGRLKENSDLMLEFELQNLEFSALEMENGNQLLVQQFGLNGTAVQMRVSMAFPRQIMYAKGTNGQTIISRVPPIDDHRGIARARTFVNLLTPSLVEFEDSMRYRTYTKNNRLSACLVEMVRGSLPTERQKDLQYEISRIARLLDRKTFGENRHSRNMRGTRTPNGEMKQVRFA